jgi:ribosome maturation factor RimP
VSSPGLERTLKVPEHFKLSAGEKVTLKTREPLVNEGHRIDGVIESADQDVVHVETGTGLVDVPYEQIKSARTVFEWK